MGPNGGTMYYSNERVCKQPSHFQKVYSYDAWSTGPLKDYGWDDINLEETEFQDKVAYTENEAELFKEYV